MSQKSFLKDTAILTISNIVTGILGFIFSIIISRELGPSGIGLYGLVMPIYNLFITLVCGGIITAISKISAEYASKDDSINLFNTIKSTLFFNLIIGLIVIIPLYFLTPLIGVHLIKDTASINALKFTCPAILFIALSNTLKGYFYGTSNLNIPAFIDICEKAIRIVTIIILISIFKEKSVTIAYATLCFGELLSFILLYIYYYNNTNKYKDFKFEPSYNLLRNVLTISIPLCLTGLFSTILATTSSLIIPGRLVHSGMNYNDAIALIGKFTGMSLTIVIFPIIIINSICTVLIPDLSQSITLGNSFAVKRRIDQVLKISLIVGAATLTIGTLLPTYLGQIFYKRSDLGTYIYFTSIVIPIFFFSNTTYGILNGLGKQRIILRNSFFMSILEISLLFFLTGIARINIFGFGIELFVTSTITSIINMRAIRKAIDFKFDYFNFILISFTCVIIVLTSSILKYLSFEYKLIFTFLFLIVILVYTSTFVKNRKFV